MWDTASSNRYETWILTYEFDLYDEELNEYTMRAHLLWVVNYEIYEMYDMYDGTYLAIPNINNYYSNLIFK